tara:strand:+ start:253 stop:762 length:510 start_codon:yes stop_codon:yes gene_type:complete
MGNYFRDYIDRVKSTKKLARDKNVPIWMIPFANAMGIILLTSVYLSIYTWVAIVDVEASMTYVPYWWTSLVSVANWLPLIYLGIITFTVLPQVLTVFILFQAALTKSIFYGIQKLDHKIWRKTGRDSYLANKIWWVQQKWMGLEKGKRRMIMACAMFAFIVWYGYRLLN